jgi:hypothetical protein
MCSDLLWRIAPSATRWRIVLGQTREVLLAGTRGTDTVASTIAGDRLLVAKPYMPGSDRRLRIDVVRRCSIQKSLDVRYKHLELPLGCL